MNNKPKRYRLLKDLPYVKAGCVYFKDNDGIYLKGDKTSYIPDALGWKHERFAIHSDWVENNPEWFCEIKEPDKIEVVTMRLHDNFLGNGAYSYWYQFSTNKSLDGTRFPAIKEAIERVLNNESIFDGKGYNWRLTDEDGQSGSIKLIRKPAKYTQEELDKAIVDAFKAAGLSFSRMGKNFDSAEDYLKSLKK